MAQSRTDLSISRDVTDDLRAENDALREHVRTLDHAGGALSANNCFIRQENQILQLQCAQLARDNKMLEQRHEQDAIYVQKVNVRMLTLQQRQQQTPTAGNADDEGRGRIGAAAETEDARLLCPVCKDAHADCCLSCGHVVCDACRLRLLDQPQALCPMCRCPMTYSHEGARHCFFVRLHV